MALFNPSASPAVSIREIDLTGGVNNVQSSTGVYVGNFRWGPADTAVLVSSDKDLAARFGTPNRDYAVDFHTAAQFLQYSNSLYVTRVVGSGAKNAVSPLENQPYTDVASTTAGAGTNATFDVLADGETYFVTSSNAGTGYLEDDILTIAGNLVGGALTTENDITITVTSVDDITGEILSFTHTGVAADNTSGSLIKNSDDFEMLTPANTIKFYARYPGDLGNALKVEIMPGIDGTHAAFNAWAYRGYFTASPEAGEMHVVVLDEDGTMTGTKGNVLETYAFVSEDPAAKTDFGAVNYVVDVINTKSKYVWFHMPNTGLNGATTLLEYRLTGGVNQDGVLKDGYNLYSDPETLTVDFLIVPSQVTQGTHEQLVTDVVSVATQRKDCVVTASPARELVVPDANFNVTQKDVDGVTDQTVNIVEHANNFPREDCLVVDNNFFKVYDKYNDQYIWVPASSGTAGLMAATDTNAAPWFSPAGQRRGIYRGVTALAYNPNKKDRDYLYPSSINPIANIPGQGVLLYGDKTFLNRPSAFDRINVRRLFYVLERAIGISAQNVLFEFNDEFTRSEFASIVEQVLRNVQGRRGITDYKVVCDETNNTPDVIDRNEFVASIFIKPARSINYITLNFVAVRTGVSFEEVVGTV